jgi:ATP-dependent DNA helicase
MHYTDLANHCLQCILPRTIFQAVFGCLPSECSAQLGRGIQEVRTRCSFPQILWNDSRLICCSQIPFVTYHGDKEHRAELRRTVMFPSDNIAEDVWAFGGPPHDLLRQRGEASSPSKKVGRPPKGKKPPPKNTSGKRGAAKFGRKPAKRQRTDSASEDEDEGAKPPPNTYPVILTTYEMVIRDQKFLCAYSWGFIVVGRHYMLFY